MQDLTCREYIKIINDVKIHHNLKEKLFKKIRYNGGSFKEDFGNQFVFNMMTQAPVYCINDIFSSLGKDFSPFLKYTKWKNTFQESCIQFFNTKYGSNKNEYFMSFYELTKNTEELSLKNSENKIFFLSMFHIAVNIGAKIEEDSVVKVIYDMFNNKENIDLDLFKEIFALYIEKITTNQKYQKRINDIKEWASTQDFSELEKKYKNIRNYFDKSNDEKLFTASSKKYDLKVIAKENKTKLTIVEQNFNALNNFISEKLKTNNNIQDFIIRDEKIFYKVLIIYDKRDFVIDAAIKMHEAFFGMIKGSVDIEKELMYSLWDKLMMKADIENSLSQQNYEIKKAELPRKVSKL